MSNPILIILLSWLLLSSVAQAHSALQFSSPSHQQTVSSPSKLELAFREPVRLVKLSVSSVDGPIDFGFSMSAQEQKTFSFKLPTLEPGMYLVNWTIMGADTHRVSKTFEFHVTQ